MYQWPRIVVTARWPPLRADGFNEVANSLLITPNILTRNDLNRSLIKNDASLIKSIAAWPLTGSNHSSLISNTLLSVIIMLTVRPNKHLLCTPRVQSLSRRGGRRRVAGMKQILLMIAVVALVGG